MEFAFNVTKEERKVLVKAAGEILGIAPVYKGAPGFAFAVGDYVIDRFGTLICEEQNAGGIRGLLIGLVERGFAFEGDIDGIASIVSTQTEDEADALAKREGVPEDGDSEDSGYGNGGIIEEIAPNVLTQTEDAADDLVKREVISEGNDSEDFGSDANVSEELGQDGGDDNDSEESVHDGGEAPSDAEPCEAVSNNSSNDDSGKLNINMPMVGFTASALGNLEKLVDAKAWIIKKMVYADELPITRDEEYLSFPWFRLESSAVEVDAYSRLVARLCETAKEKQRVTATERRLEDGDNEKFKARCFLLSLGFIGKEYAQARKVLLAPMSGSGSFKTGGYKRQGVTVSVTIADNGEENVEAVHVREDVSNADTGANTRPKCHECLHHCYYSDGEMLTAVGDAVDTSKRTPEKYTHYCLKAPSGFRRIKHATDWSGCETAPKWCPLFAESTEDDSSDGEGIDLGNAQTSGEEVAV